MDRFLLTGLAALGVMAAPGTLAAEDKQLRDTASSEIEVQGDRPLDRGEIIHAQRYLYDAGRPYRTVPRFRDPVCLAVVGLAGRQNQIVADRIRANMQEAGAALAQGPCKPNAVVAANRRPAALIKALRGRDPHLFNRSINAAIDRQLAKKRQVIAWGDTSLRANDGVIIGNRTTARPNPLFDLPLSFLATPSRQPASLYESKVNAFVFFDLDGLEDVHVNQLADYATLHLLGSPRDPADHETAAVPTILSLFDEGPTRAPAEMTSLDRAYLRGLYRLDSTEWGWQLTASVLDAYRKPTAVQDGETADSPRSASPS